VARRGRFITIEGGEGVGKSSLLKGLAEILRAAGHEVVVTREPGGTPSADRIRSLFALHDPSDPWLPESEALLISAARAQHVGRVIAPALTRGAWVLCDRFADSTRVYQGVLGGLDAAKLETMIALSTGGVTPDLTLVLDCDVDVALSRIAKSSSDRRDEVARFDQEDKARHEKRRAAYKHLVAAYGERCHLVDGGQSPEAVLNTATTILAKQFTDELIIAGDLSRPSGSVLGVVPKP
jgi:dTMP kinase